MDEIALPFLVCVCTEPLSTVLVLCKLVMPKTLFPAPFQTQ